MEKLHKKEIKEMEEESEIKTDDEMCKRYVEEEDLPREEKKKWMKKYVEGWIKRYKVLMFSETDCPFSTQIKQFFLKGGLDDESAVFEFDKIEHADVVREILEDITG
jgi:hypothetical protein